jgi:uncharacterized membrane protein YphA (DoxX/SURF4 family)
VTKYAYPFGFWTIAALVALRVLIGWHFLSAGVEKLDPSFSAAGFLGSANGPMADFYKSMVPQPHDWDNLVTEPMPSLETYVLDRKYVDKNWKEVDRPVGNDKIGHIPYPTDAYGPWARRIADDWHQTLEEFKALPNLSDEQKAAAEQAFFVQYVHLAHFFEENKLAIEEYHYEAQRLAKMQEDAERHGSKAPFQRDRIQVKKAEINATPRKWVAGVASEEEVYHRMLGEILSSEQREDKTTAEKLSATLHPPQQIDLINSAVMWLTTLVGICLIIGLFTRVAAIVGAGFLLSIMSTQPPWVEEVLDTVKLIFAYQGIEMIALFLLAFIGAGAWWGLDGAIWGRKVVEIDGEPVKL